jgi:hypothetical protein
MNDPMKQDTPETAPPLLFSFPALGEGSASDYRRAGKEVGAEYGRRWLSIVAEAKTNGVLSDHFINKLTQAMLGDMLGTVTDLHDRGYAAGYVAKFEEGMSSGHKLTLAHAKHQGPRDGIT